MDNDVLMANFRSHAQKLREQYGAMDDTAPLLWDLSRWLERELLAIGEDEAEFDRIRRQMEQP